MLAVTEYEKQETTYEQQSPQPEVEFTTDVARPAPVEHGFGSPREGVGVDIAMTKYGEALERLADS